MKRIMIALIMIATVTLVACSLEKPKLNESNTVITKEAQPSNELNYALWSAPSGIFAPQYAKGDYDEMIIGLAYEPLVMINTSNEFEGVLAESWEILDDQKTIIYYLRNNVKWHDGADFTARDVAFSLKYIADKKYDGDNFYAIATIDGIDAYHRGEIDHISGIEIINDQTIKITTKDVHAPTLEHIGNINIFPEHLWKDVEIENAIQDHKLLTTTVGTGPYILESVIPNQEVRMSRNDAYWGGEPKIEYINFVIVNSEIAQIKMINGELDVMQISSMDPKDLQLYEDAGILIKEVNYNAFQSMTINTEHDLLGNIYVRQAFAMAIDRQSIVDTLIFGHGSVANTVYKQDYWAYPDDRNINTYDYNPQKAISYMVEKADCTYKDGIMYFKDAPITLSLVYPSGNKARELSAPVIQENLKNIGIDVHLKKMEFAELTELTRGGDYDMSLIGNGFKLDPDVSRMFSSSSIDSNNVSRYFNAELDQLLIDGVKSYSHALRKEIYGEVAAHINEHLPIVFLYNWSEGRVLSERLRGVECYPHNYFYKVHEWYFEE